MHTNSNEIDLAILVGVNVTESGLDELAALCSTCNIKTVGCVVQNRKDVDVTYYIGKGKVDEIKQLIDETGATVVVFDVELSGSKVRNLEEVLHVPVLDRSKVILDIFAQRAQSMEGKMQVELAQLKYNLPRLVGTSGISAGLIKRDGGVYTEDIMAKMRSSVGMRGPGEKKLELDKRTIRDQITALEGKLQKIAANRDLTRRGAVKSGKTRVCIVGYTNSGKSTLLNTIAKAGVVAEDKLFATLDPKTANVYIDGVQILMTDTVGFINKLPHEFIRAFESTLDEARLADLLLHVVDISNPEYKKQIDVVNEVLAKIGAKDVPVIMVYNKTDLSTFETKEKNAVVISALANTGIDELKRKIREFANG
jgi:GTP-binding protein HflX